MADGDLVVADQQAQIRTLLMGPGSSYCWADEIPNWWGIDGMRTHDVPRSSTHGVRGGRDLLPSKTITGKVFAQATTRAALNTLVDNFMAAWGPSNDDIAFVAQFLDAKRRRYGRPRRAAPTTRTMTRWGAVNKFGTIIAFQFEALDPMIYADALQQVSTGRQTPATGVALPVTLPMVLPNDGATGTMIANNAGTASAPWTGRLDGPLVNPRILHTESGKSLQFTANGGLTINSGEFVNLDSINHSVLFNGVGDRRLTLLLQQGWFALQPGANTVQLVADSGAGTFTLNWRDTYTG